MNNNIPMIKKEGLFTKIKSWFKRLIGKEEIIIEPVKEYTKNEIEEIKKDSFREGLKVKSKDVILFLQKKLEEKKIQISDLTDEQLEEMVELYNNQTNEIKNKTQQIINKTEQIKRKYNV